MKAGYLARRTASNGSKLSRRQRDMISIILSNRTGGHIYALSSYLNINKRVFKSIIVFSNKATLKITTDTPVIHMSHLKREILSYSQEIIPGSEVDSIYNSLNRISLTGTENEKRHVQSVKQNVEEKQRALRSGICPRCGGELVLRKGKYGDFYGCSNYPKCKFTQNIRK